MTAIQDPQVSSAMEEFRNYLTSPTAEGIEKAAATNTAFIRRQLREESFMEAILPVIPITVEECDRSEFVDEPRKIVDVESDSPAALVIGLATAGPSIQIRPRRISAQFNRIRTQTGVQDKVRLATNKYDIRKVFMDNQLRDALARYDGAAISQVDAVLGAADSTVSATGKVQHRSFSEWTRKTWRASTNIMPGGFSRMHPAFYLVNQVFFSYWMDFDRSEMGGDLAQTFLTKGVAMADGPNNSKFIVTIKDDLVPNNTYYQFAAPEALGVAYELEAPTVHMKNDGPMISFYMYFMRALVFGNLGGLAKATWEDNVS
jgi:hypothetical protein